MEQKKSARLAVRAQVPMVTVFTFVNIKSWRSIIMLGNKCRRFGFFTGCIAVFLLIANPTTWRDRFMITGSCHYNLTYG